MAAQVTVVQASMEEDMEMNWQHKALAIQALTGPFGFSISMRKLGDWYVSHKYVSRKEGGCLSHSPQNGKDPEDAVNQCWEWMTDPKFYMVKYEDAKRRAVKWNGFMWEDVNEETT